MLVLAAALVRRVGNAAQVRRLHKYEGINWNAHNAIYSDLSVG
jgi:hypothetical protein